MFCPRVNAFRAAFYSVLFFKKTFIRFVLGRFCAYKQMLDKRLIVGGAHFAVTAVILKLLGLILPCCITCYYSGTANFLLYLFVARFTFEFTKKWYLNERLQPENRAVFITGCDSGFGHHTAKVLDALGYPVFAGCLDQNGHGAKELKSFCSKRLQIIEVDVRSDSSVKNAANFVRNNLGTAELWAIVNNAGILKGFEVELTDLEDFRDTMEVNAFGQIRVTKAFLPMLRQSRGRIVNVNSMGGRLPLPYATPYIMSKYASVGFTECLRLEMDVWKIRVISIEPDFFRTGLTSAENLKKQVEESMSKCDPDVREDYGEKYIRDFKFFNNTVSSFCSRNVDLVVNAIDAAVSLKYPDSVYQPCRNLLFQIGYYLLQVAPRNMIHIVKIIVCIITGFPKPKEAENYL